ncbi:MAG: pyrophosphate--fructose-6-phosphate 1-phosphotransferase [Propionibacterium sp.]|jgi:pyrophosphate--fructose-6-phosphate 1-phosphotransferase|uniref:Pyrophosphate--fructose 6-phosphate 1-phosphotransferase n=1 Tax=Brooklawnia propionicigenes TaxID=3041175 RepID=A0AAN0K9X6_9ACTN|nr:pyrophosphate--fructose-6-phosphate 1-phosphotransferase [Brooklawnia sp. SH051]MEA5121082.1 pyrophosphate--fructose-6-phosphate 1-phosphotransferase [Propionibacterium sp.]NLI86594.1 pyrophosphate--fructose-6-phosphate 1-phosphotransferase [Propionibacterium sp.]BEH00830.1 pyrophosphate--fructose-6-phosphate 1-phosphotransferase [Brooklawnia sp. SH051]
MVNKVGLLTAGGFAPCLSSAVAGLITRYTELAPEIEIIAYRHGYEGLLKGDSVVVTPEVRAHADRLYKFGGSPIGNSRVKLTNVADLVKRGLVAEGENPLEVAAKQLVADGVDVLHTIGGDDTNTTAADLAAYLADNDFDLTVVGLPKTIDNDIVPIRQSLGAWTAADEAADYAKNIIAEHNAAPRELIIHEIMGRNCGYLAAETTKRYQAWLDEQEWLPEIGLSREAWAVHAVYLPEVAVDLDAEAERLSKIMDEVGNVNIFLSEGAGVAEIVEQMEKNGEKVPKDAFGHVQIDKINPGAWFGKQFSKRIGAQKTMVQKSGYFSRSAPSNDEDLALIGRTCVMAVDAALAGTPGVIGLDEENNDQLSVIDFPRIAGHKPFDITQPWFVELSESIGMPKPEHAK